MSNMLFVGIDMIQLLMSEGGASFPVDNIPQFLQIDFPNSVGL